MAFCLPFAQTKKFIESLKSGAVDPVKLAQMTSAERNAFFEKLIGKENASPVNALFESKLLLKNQQAGMIAWAKKTAGLSPKARRGIIERIQRMEKALDATSERTFLQDLASQKLSTEVTFEEAQQVVKLSKEVTEAKSKIKDSEPARSENRLEYGVKAAFLLKKLVGDLKVKGNDLSLTGYLTHPKRIYEDVLGASKSMLSTLDNSFFGRQGIKIFFDPKTTHIWVRNFVKSWGDFKKELGGTDAMIPIQADVYSRPNALNGKYDAMKVEVGLKTEEAFPNSIPTKVPILGRLFKASESAYNGGALRMRADLADFVIKNAEKNGIDILTDKANAEGLGLMVNSATGRGNLGKLEVVGKDINLILFSGKFLKSNIDTLIAPLKAAKDVVLTGETTYARKQAAYQTLRIVGSMAATLAVIEALNPGSVETDPRSSYFGKVNIGGRWFDVSGGMASLVTLSTRLVPTYHNDKWGFWTKGPNGKYKELATGKFGSLTPMDYLESFLQGKLAPILSTIVTILKQRDFQGEKPSPTSVAKNLITPIPLQTFESLMKDPQGADILTTMILEGLGFSSSPDRRK